MTVYLFDFITPKCLFFSPVWSGQLYNKLTIYTFSLRYEYTELLLNNYDPKWDTLFAELFGLLIVYSPVQHSTMVFLYMATASYTLKQSVWQKPHNNCMLKKRYKVKYLRNSPLLPTMTWYVVVLSRWGLFVLFREMRCHGNWSSSVLNKVKLLIATEACVIVLRYLFIYLLTF